VSYHGLLPAVILADPFMQQQAMAHLQNLMIIWVKDLKKFVDKATETLLVSTRQSRFA
jgi:hypothetical protein